MWLDQLESEAAHAQETGGSLAQQYQVGLGVSVCVCVCWEEVHLVMCAV